MRKKAIIVIDGVNDGKTLFSKVAKNENLEFYQETGFWTWAINPNNVLGVVSRTLGSPGVRDDRYYEFIGKLKELANDYWDFEDIYIDEMIEKFRGNDKTELLVVHGADSDMAIRLKEDHGAMTLYLTSQKSNKNFESEYDKVLVWDEDGFVDNVVEFLTVLTKE
jgi:hypothetical protein